LKIDTKRGAALIDDGAECLERAARKMPTANYENVEQSGVI